MQTINNCKRFLSLVLLGPAIIAFSILVLALVLVLIGTVFIFVSKSDAAGIEFLVTYSITSFTVSIFILLCLLPTHITKLKELLSSKKMNFSDLQQLDDIAYEEIWKMLKESE